MAEYVFGASRRLEPMGERLPRWVVISPCRTRCMALLAPANWRAPPPRWMATMAMSMPSCRSVCPLRESFSVTRSSRRWRMSRAFVRCSW